MDNIDTFIFACLINQPPKRLYMSPGPDEPCGFSSYKDFRGCLFKSIFEILLLLFIHLFYIEEWRYYEYKIDFSGEILSWIAFRFFHWQLTCDKVTTLIWCCDMIPLFGATFIFLDNVSSFFTLARAQMLICTVFRERKTDVQIVYSIETLRLQQCRC